MTKRKVMDGACAGLMGADVRRPVWRTGRSRHCVRGTAARAQELVLGDVGLTAKGCGALAEALGGMGRLRKLDLGCVEGQCGGGGVCGTRVMGCVEQRAAWDGAWRGGERGVLMVCAGAVVAGVAACMRAV